MKESPLHDPPSVLHLKKFLAHKKKKKKKFLVGVEQSGVRLSVRSREKKPLGIYDH